MAQSEELKQCPPCPRRHGGPLRCVRGRYANKRLLYRLSVSAFADRFVRATLLMAWLDEPHCGTRDRDLLCFGAPPDPGAILALFRQVLAIEVDDGIAFDASGLAVRPIRGASATTDFA